MHWNFKEILATFSRGSNHKYLKDSKHGLERECLRIDRKGNMAQTPHPKALGSALTHPYITTDFSEAQLELITPPLDYEQAPIEFLENIHLFLNRNLPKDELIWPFSMPCVLPKEKNIPIAQYGKSQKGLKRTLYRLGLENRYGKKMQTVSGIHYNFSFSDGFWRYLHKTYAPKEDFRKFKDAKYLHIIRNFLRYSWLNTYLFGAAPCIDKTYLKKRPKYLKKLTRRTYYGEYATSFRTSSLGYYSKVQAQLAVSFNDLESYLNDLYYALTTPSPNYKGIPGLNENILQIENEHYSRIRPKAILGPKDTPLKALERDGIKYLEVRVVDINPYLPEGVKKNQLRFLYIFLIYCLFKDARPLTELCKKTLTENQNKVALFGRDPRLKIIREKDNKEILMLKYAEEILKEMQPIAEILNKNCPDCGYSESFDLQFKKLRDVNLLASQQIINELKEGKESFLQMGLRLANKYNEELKKTKLNKKFEQEFKDLAKKSLKNQENLEIRSEFILDDYEDMELSTQILIRECWRRKIKVEILDRSANFLRLSKGRKVEYVRQATKTRLDSYIAMEIMGNKFVHKRILAEHGIKVPTGGLYTGLEEATKAYPIFENKKIVIKPTTTNYGIGIQFVDPKKPQAYEQALKEAFKHDNSVIVEEFVSGKEVRLLVMGDKFVSALQRIPSNVVGDGKHTIRELLKIKNEDARSYKPEIYYGRTGPEEKAKLAEQGLTFESIPKKGQQVFLRDNSNVSTGGDPIEVADQVPEKFKKIAVQAAKAADATFCGIDMIINGDDYAIIEINYNPALQMHEFPYRGKRVKVAAKVLDLLGF